MKKLNIVKTGILFLLVLVMGACNKWIDPDINVSPDKPQTVTMATLMAIIQADAAFTTAGGNDIVRTQSCWIQQLDGIARQSMIETNYQLRSGDVNNLWNTIYAGQLMDIQVLQGYATTYNSVHFEGASKVLQAFILGQTTDVWNDIPYSEALMGDENTKPMFDNQEKIYSDIQALLDDGIAKLSSVDESPFPLDGDYLYEGDIELWIKAAYALKARYYLMVEKRLGNSAYTMALDQLDKAISDNSEDMQFNYGPGTQESNPLYQFMRDRGDVVMNAFFIDLLLERFDPRIHVYAYPDNDTALAYSGSVTGSANANASAPGPAIAGATAPTYFITYSELLFLKAECLYKTGDEEGAKTAVLAGLEASFNKLGVFDQVYYDNYELALGQVSGVALFHEIMTQKYIATCYQSIGFDDWRRTENLIGLTPNQTTNPGATPADYEVMPRRFPYSNDEITYNPNTPQGVLITDRVWWDVKN